MSEENIYVRYYVGHRDPAAGHEFLEFEIKSTGKLRYANNSHYRNETMIRKELHLSQQLMDELKRIVLESNILNGDDSNWPEPPNDNSKQELEIVYGNDHISFCTAKIGSLLDVQSSKDPEGLRAFYYLVQDIKCYVLSIISMHFKIKPIQ
eukprot:TRINITY_DN5700_c0_g1_i2.p2 TRINITY_DN5700_c0_g1~~TRINITY_DN5700_c0_g1_i2.p2  ORF type:complete len:172 (-),score=49.59 TRINITY_DN5700_c0_g1_i2:83-535(-)